MPDEIEIPTDQLQDSIQEEYERTEDTWILRVAVTAALLAVFAAIASLYAGHHANEALLEQMKASDHWSYYQAKSIQSLLLQNRIDMLHILKQSADAEDRQKLETYAVEMAAAAKEAKQSELASHDNFSHHATLAKAVTALQIGIAICAIAALTKRKWLWYISIISGLGGLVLQVMAFYGMH